MTEQAIAAATASRERANQRFILRMGVACALLVGCVLFSLSQGAADIPFDTTLRIVMAELHLPVDEDEEGDLEAREHPREECG